MRFSLNKSQSGVYYACVTNSDELVNYQNPVLLEIPQGVNSSQLRKAVYDTLCAHPYIASRIVLGEDGVPEAESGVFPAMEDTVPLVSVDSIEDVKSGFAKTMDIYADKLYRCELYQTADGRTWLYLDFHHIIADGFSVVLILKDIERCFNGMEPAVEEMDGIAVAREEEALCADEARMTEAREWYGRTFCDAAETDSLPIPESTLGDVPAEMCLKHYPLSVTKDDVRDIMKRFNIKEGTLMQAAWALLLAAYGAEDKASYCTLYFGRGDRRTRSAVTMMVHTFPVFVQFQGEEAIGELFASLTEQMAVTRQMQYYSYQDAVKDLGLGNQVMFVYHGSVLDTDEELHFGQGTATYYDLRKQIPGWKLVAELFGKGDGYSLKLGYSSTDYSDAFMEELAASYSAIIRSMLTANIIKELEYALPDQVKWLDSLNPDIKPVALPTLVERFRQHVAERPDDIFCVAGDKRLTFAEVDRLTDTIDPSYTVRCGEHVVGFSVPRDEKMVLAPLAIAKAGLTQLPLDSSYPQERLEFMKQDAAAYDGNDALVLLYTSGTTGTPKGVMLSEENFRIFSNFHVKHVGLKPGSRYATYAGYGFDAYQHDLWACVWAGATIYIIQDDIRFNLEALYEYLVKEGITHCFMTTQMATQMALSYPDIAQLQYLGTGGEKLMSLNPPSYRLLNAYGPTETTCYVCSHYVDRNEPNIPIGRPNDTVEMYIVNRFGKQVPWGCCGELIIAGPQVGIGYLNQPEKTATSFVEWHGKRIYRSGDIVRYRENGDIEFVGRKDGQVKIRGFRIELKEVEAVIRQFPGIKDATVQAFDYPTGGKYIAAYIVADEQIDVKAMNSFIMDQKPPYMVPAATMQIDAIPLNQNQKVNRRALPEPVFGAAAESEEESAAPLNILEQQLKDIVAEVLNTDAFGITTDLRYAGLTSILAIKVATQIYKRFGVQLDAQLLTKGANIQTVENEILATMLSGGAASASVTGSAGVTSDASSPVSAPLSYAQTGVYFDCMKNPASTLYNTPVCLTFPIETDAEALRKAAVRAAENHPALFVQFKTDEGGVVQVMGDRETPVEVEDYTMSEEEALAFRHGFVRPFNLGKDRLFRLATIHTEKALYLYCDIHHLVCDGYSYDLFIQEICDLMEGREIEPEMCSYMQFVMDQKAAENGEAFASAAEFFRQRLGDVEEVTELAPDLSNPLPQGENGRVWAPIVWSDAEQLAKKQGVKPSAVLLSAVFYSLSRFSGNDHICITTISNGRNNLKVANTMGMFVNTLALSSRIGSQSVQEFLHESEETFEQTLAHENYPFARVAADYGLKADIMFAYQMGILSDYRVGGKKVTADETMELNVPKFKIAFYITDEPGEPGVAIEYDNGQYSEAMMQSLAQSVGNAVSAFAAAADKPLRSISLLDNAGITLLDSFNRTAVDYDDTQTILSLFSRQVRETPDNLAVVYHDVRLTYREVDEKTDAIAAAVSQIVNRKSSNCTSPVVSILIGRSEWMVLASLGVLKAGCAYQPLDPSYPSERLNFMMQDADAKLLIAEEALLEKVGDYQGPVLLTKDLRNIEMSKCRNVEIKPEDLFILLYTSGSTGNPKGCQLEHRNLVAFCHWYQRYYDLHPGDKVAAYASYGFDACMMDMYPALATGAAVVIVGDDIRLNLPDLNAYFNAEGVTHSFMTTQVGCQFAMNCDNHSLRHLSVGGEKILPLTPPASYKLHNAYGPTECTIFTTIYQQTQYEQNAPIGKPLDNLQLYIVDKDMNRLPLGAAGELLVSGPQVSRGYLNLPEKTAETYVQWNGRRCYRTGDVVRYLADGNIQFVGRRDGQVKIRGFRIELKEVEAVIREYPGISDATVQAFDYPNGGKFIAAYVVSESPIDIQALNAFIRDRKPPYMVPAATMQIPEIPLNQNQKVNRRALPAPQIQLEERDYVAPVGEVETLFCDIFAGILSLDKVGATDNFFEMGGTSLMVTKVVIEADKAGHHVAYGDVFDHPTPRLLAQFVGGAAPADAVDTEIENFDYTGIDAILQHNNTEMFLQGERQQLGNVLLTGATGYLGIHVLRELIDSDAATITCLVRGKDQSAAEHRLKNLLFYYFEQSFGELFGTRLFVVNGDVTQDFTEIVHSTSIDTVFNCAANVKHYSKGTDIEDVNIGGARRCVEFCLNTGARLIHISTTSVAEIWIDRGDGSQVPMLDERKLWFGQFLDNRYIHSKFLAERLILDAVARHGLNAKVMRVGNLAPRSYDGEFQANFNSNSFMGRLKVFYTLGCCPYDIYDEHTEMSPIDETAKAVVLLASTPRECTVFQPFNNHTELLGDVLLLMKKVGREMRFVENDEFDRTIAVAGQDPEKAKLLAALVAYQDVAHGQKTAIIERDNRYTCNILHRLGFHWKDTSWDYVEQMMTAISQLGFFDEKSR
ncbi:MAG: amino acid adenylation domain-containing protein [Bacteroidaceae bacterium]|nr:amino acid adenylation domain-containing protein [Bacteroidaceae bacterium]